MNQSLLRYFQSFAITSFFSVIFSLGTLFAQATFQSGPEQTSMIELFTSEGCSSCPPADRRMSEFLEDPNLWITFVPVSFHVDYWNNLGWKDSFSKEDFTERQREYAREWKSSSIYTPNFVLNGADWRQWYEKGMFQQPLQNRVGILRVEVDATQISVRYEAAQDISKPLKVYCAILGFGIESNVTRGENANKILKHDFVVLSLQEKSLQFEADGQVWIARFPVLKVEEQVQKKGVVVWVSQREKQAPIQATGGFIS